jgi:acylpyruvate hydrolase
MRLVAVRTAAGTVAAVEEDGVRRALLDDAGRPFADVGDLLRRGDLGELRRGDALDAALSLARPVLHPGAVVCVGLNYRTHVLEMGRELPSAPTYFAKFTRALTDPDTSIVMPDASSQVDYEGELAVVIGAGGRDLAADRAWEAVAGLTLLNDVTMRDWQARSSQFLAGKTWQSSTPLGPALVTPDELTDLARREITTRVNGQERQRAPIGDQIFDVAQLVADVSRIIALEPGDVIATGTPGGVGHGMKPPRHLQPGDVVEIELPGIGVLRNRFVRAPTDSLRSTS